MALKTILCNFLNLLEDNKCLKNLGKDVYELEFQKLKALTDKLKQDPEFSCKYGAQEINRCKNRYKDILPYDITRVILTKDSEIPGSDYINANYIKGASNSMEYIASQGPLPNTVVDFWRMIWECEIKIVIMACNERESGKQKCECYWPEEEKENYGNIFVEILKTQIICPDFLVRTFKAVNNNKERLIYQFHYTTWPDHGVPESVEPILQLIQLVRKFQTSEAVPILVHCSAGCGRTGTICSIDYVWRLMKMGKLTESFNLFEIISKMRKQRIAMVQTKEQYILVHRAVAALFEHQIELIDNHIYENLDESGQPLLKNSEEINICEKINETEDIDFSESQNQSCFNDYSSKLKEVPLDENSEETLPVMNDKRFEDGNQTTNSINCVTNENNYDQNVNFTISLPLNSAKKQSDNLSVSTTLIYNDNRIMVNLKQKETENIQNPESNNEYHITEIESNYDLRNFADSEVETTSSYSPNENKLMKLSEDNCSNLEYKNSDIEDIFLQILNDDDKQSNEKSDDKFRTNMDISSNSNYSLEKGDKNYEEIIDKSLDEMVDQNSVNLFERDVLHNLTSDSVIASRQRYMCLVNECEQSFSEIERLLEEKNFENSKNILHKNNTKEDLNFDQSISNGDKLSKHEEPVCSFKVNELIQRNSTNLPIKFDETTNNDAVESFHSKKEVEDFKNNYDDTKTPEQITEDDKLKYLGKKTDNNNRGIEEVLMKNQENNEETIEYIDSVTQEAIIVNELPQNHHKINYSISEGISNFENCENSNFEIGDKSLKNLNYQSKLTPYIEVEKNSENFKSNLARKRTGKIFDAEDDRLNFKQERSSSFFVNNYSITDNDKHNISSISNSDDNEINECAKNDFPLSETYEYENFTENSINEKSAVAQKPSIAKLKALFEKSVVHDLPKHKHKHPLARSHSHHISQSKSGHLYSSNERTVLKPTIFNKVSKIFHTPSYEEHNEICSSKLNIHKNLKEPETASISSNFCEQFLKDNESRSQWYDGTKHSYLEINPNPFNSESKLPSNKNTKNEVNKRDSNAIEIGCLDISSLMSSVISDEQTVSQTQWYEENNQSSISQYKETMHKENLSQNVSEERNSEECNVKDYINISLDSSEENELSRLSDTNIKIPPEIPNKKKFQNISFHSYQDNIQIKKQNFSDKLENTTKWYFKKENSDDENNNDHIENINNDDLNAETNLESYDDSLTTLQENIHNLSPNILIKSNLDNFFNKQPPHLPPKKKCDKSNNHTNWYLKEKSADLYNTENINDSENVVYANVIKAKNGSLIESENSKKQMFHKLDEEKTDLYMNVNATTRKNIEQIENSLQQHPRGAIIDLTSRQSFANEQQMNNCNEQNVKELKKTFSSDFKGKLKEYQKIILNPSKKPKGYETIWPQKCNNENNQSFVNNSDKKLSTNKNLHKHQENLEPSQKICDEYKMKPQPKPRSSVSDKHISKSNSSSVLFQKHSNVKNSVSDFNRFKETSVNKVVCELNSILNVLTTRPFKSSKPEASVISSSENSQKIHPSAPPRRKLKQDISDCQFSNSEIYSSNHSTSNTANSNSINKIESKGQQLSKSTTLPNINYLNSKVLSQISKEKNNKVSDNESARHIKDSKRLHSVYENIDTTQSNISHMEDQETSDNFKNKMHKLKHSTSDASVFSVLRNAKYKSKLATSSAIKTENKLNDKRKQTSKLKEENKVIENKASNLCDIPKQFIHTITKNEKRSVDDMDIFPVAPPRSRRHGPTLKSVSEMEKFTKSLDEVGSKFPTLSVDALKSSKFSFQKKFQNNYTNSNASGYSHSVSTGIGYSTDKSVKTDNLTNPISRTKSLKIIPLQKISDGSLEMKPSDKDGRSIQTDTDSSGVNQYTKLSQGSICKNEES